jgi:hypothetical protein
METASNAKGDKRAIPLANCAAWMTLCLVIVFPNFDPTRRTAAAEATRKRSPAGSLYIERGRHMPAARVKFFARRLICA